MHRAQPGAPEGCSRPVAQLAAVQDRLAGWISDLTTLHDLTERLARAATLDATLHETLRGGAALVGARRGVLALNPADGLGPQRTVGLGLGHAELGQIETVPLTANFGRLLDGLPGPGGLPGPEGALPDSGRARRSGFPAYGTPTGWPPGFDEVTHPDLAHEEGLDPRHREVAARLGYAASYAAPLTATPPGPTTAGPTMPGPTASAPTTADSTAPSPTPPSPAASSPAMPAPAVTAARGSGAPGCGLPGARLGAAVWLYDEPSTPSERQRHLLALYLGCAAEHIARRLELARARTAVAAVREELLPSRLPRVPGVRLAVRHRTGPRGGGDWYDVLPLPEGAFGLSVGGVSGTGPGVPAVMGRLRASLRAYAVMEGEDPVAVLSDLELLLRLTEPARPATALFGYAETAARRVTVAGAGHCPPLIVGPSRCEFAETTLSAPLNMLTCWEAPSVELHLAPGETLLLYSDGLVQRTGEPADRAFARVHAAAQSAAPSVRDDPEALTDHVLHTVLPDGLADLDSEEDVVLLAARF
ncbi:serine/threonine-protein phosphatase [Streptomyces sp. JJ66]|uniref:PP2C family protein-serine/threonine phosphatase n=1 Tax=Streptomyces sp. JJ66 TaxID=2803843 RepID=UPI001C5854F1|nr:PP2C family protein-serine/threonine phosphatase [Streptomyces sp. JJ66]MBW1604124.1 serine/threonine-protein phosphatase [Streptomyces sp. JJ66]